MLQTHLTKYTKKTPPDQFHLFEGSVESQ